MITSYKELKVWEKADELAFQVFDLTDLFPRRYLYDLTSQLRRAALSVPTNIAEGCASFHSGEFLQFLNISRRSLSEAQYLLYFASRRNLIKETQLSELESIGEEISKMLNALAKSIRNKIKTSKKSQRFLPDIDT
ncbi:MAG: four helix bundle protein [Deltaproteobacteria bacterium]|nr:four helix bundle protein [Deltaproteobacteria bacterium]